MENPPFWLYLPGNMRFSWAMLVSGRVVFQGVHCSYPLILGILTSHWIPQSLDAWWYVSSPNRSFSSLPQYHSLKTQTAWNLSNKTSAEWNKVLGCHLVRGYANQQFLRCKDVFPSQPVCFESLQTITFPIDMVPQSTQSLSQMSH